MSKPSYLLEEQRDLLQTFQELMHRTAEIHLCTSVECLDRGCGLHDSKMNTIQPNFSALYRAAEPILDVISPPYLHLTVYNLVNDI